MRVLSAVRAASVCSDSTRRFASLFYSADRSKEIDESTG
jgi:hypothetical protein